MKLEAGAAEMERKYATSLKLMGTVGRPNLTAESYSNYAIESISSVSKSLSMSGITSMFVHHNPAGMGTARVSPAQTNQNSFNNNGMSLNMSPRTADTDSRVFVPMAISGNCGNEENPNSGPANPGAFGTTRDEFAIASVAHTLRTMANQESLSSEKAR
jgi:hypothetical protein